MKSISLGQYYPADSLIHRLDGRTKILLATIFIISVFLLRPKPPCLQKKETPCGEKEMFFFFIDSGVYKYF